MWPPVMHDTHLTTYFCIIPVEYRTRRAALTSRRDPAIFQKPRRSESVARRMPAGWRACGGNLLSPLLPSQGDGKIAEGVLTQGSSFLTTAGLICETRFGVFRLRDE